MIIGNFSIRIEKYPYFNENLPDKMKNLSLGLLLNSEKIDFKIKHILEDFQYTFYTNFFFPIMAINTLVFVIGIM
jgi:hypothetical protein